MTAPGVPHRRQPLAGVGTTARRRFTGSDYGPGSPGGPTEWYFTTHRPCPIDGCAGRPQVSVRSAADPPAVDHDAREAEHDAVLCTTCGAGPCVPAGVRA